MINLTTGGAPYMTVQERVKPAETFKPEVASLNMGSMNFGLFPMLEPLQGVQARLGAAGAGEFARPGVPQHLQGHRIRAARRCGDAGTRFEFECYDTSHLYNLAHFLERGLVKPPLFVQTVFGILGGIGPHPEDVMHMKRTADRLFGKDYKWSVLGAGRNQLPIAAQAAAMGGNVRVGLEDSLWAGPGRLATSNAEQVRTVRQIIEGLGLDGRDARRGARDPGAEGRRQGRVLSVRGNAMLRIELITDARAELGEGPLWDVAEQRLYWIDSLGAKVHSCDAGGGSPRTWTVPEHIGSLALRQERRRGRVAARRLLCAGLRDRRLPQARRSRSRQAAHSHERRQGRPPGPLRRRLHGL